MIKANEYRTVTCGELREENIGQQKNISWRMSQLRQTLENENALDVLD